jgi:hypothetical protein
MAKRSPKYPSDSLSEALERVRAVYDSDRQNPIDRATVAQHMGYSGISGASDKAISNLMQYGLLERIGKGEVRVSQLAVDILYPAPGDDGARAMHEAGYRPELFADLKSRFLQTPSREALKSYLRREGFLESAINPATSAYLETCLFLEQSGANDFSIPSDSEPPQSAPVRPQETRPMQAATATQPAPQADIVTAVVGADVLNLSGGGQAALRLPDTLSRSEYEDLKDWLELMARRAQRRVKSDEEATED